MLRRFKRPCRIIALGALCLFIVLPTSSFGAGCTYEDCWTCRSAGFFSGTYCAVANNYPGRLCCNEYPDGLGGTECRIFDAFCYGIIVQDI